MNHLKSYKIFESISVDEIKDILVTLKDRGYTTITNVEGNTIEVIIMYDDDSTFEISEISDEINMVYKYSISNNCKIKHLYYIDEYDCREYVDRLGDIPYYVDIYSLYMLIER